MNFFLKSEGIVIWIMQLFLFHMTFTKDRDKFVI